MDGAGITGQKTPMTITALNLLKILMSAGIYHHLILYYEASHRTEIAVLVLRKGYSSSRWLWDFCYYINQAKQTQPFSRPIFH